MSKQSGEVPPEKLALYRQLIDAHAEIELKGGRKLPHTSYRGNMFTMLSKAGKVGLRMGKTEREAFIRQFDSRLFETYGTVMKEYVEAPDGLLEDTEALLPYLEQSFAYAKTLKPKARKRKS